MSNTLITTADIDAHASGNADACTACHGTGQDIGLVAKPCWICDGTIAPDCGLCNGRGIVHSPATGMFDGTNQRRCPAATAADQRRPEAAAQEIRVHLSPDFDAYIEGRTTAPRSARCALCNRVGCPCQTMRVGSDEWYEAIQKEQGTGH